MSVAIHPLVQKYLDNQLKIAEQWKQGLLTKDDFEYITCQILVDYESASVLENAARRQDNELTLH